MLMTFNVNVMFLLSFKDAKVHVSKIFCQILNPFPSDKRHYIDDVSSTHADDI